MIGVTGDQTLARFGLRVRLKSESMVMWLIGWFLGSRYPWTIGSVALLVPSIPFAFAGHLVPVAIGLAAVAVGLILDAALDTGPITPDFATGFWTTVGRTVYVPLRRDLDAITSGDPLPDRIVEVLCHEGWHRLQQTRLTTPVYLFRYLTPGGRAALEGEAYTVSALVAFLAGYDPDPLADRVFQVLRTSYGCNRTDSARAAIRLALQVEHFRAGRWGQYAEVAAWILGHTESALAPDTART